ncbi:hypothetical protein ILYODFUR_015274 [Ilyodon furcidens]|uniref:Uncharacterized protein n=1 Tax=Ilyodon furcidens TaxID=33524 RepID=A0ABV0UHQ4_9TELE
MLYLYTRKLSSPAIQQAVIKRGMTPDSQSVFLSFVAEYRSFHPSIHPCLHPSCRQVSDQSSQGYFLHLHPSAEEEQGMMTDNTGSRRIPTHTPHTCAAYSVPTRLLLGFQMSRICMLGTRRMCMQMQTMLIVIKGHLPLRVSPFSSSSSFCLLLLTSLSVTPCLSFFSCCPFHSTFPIPYNFLTADFSVIILCFY